MKLSLKVQGMHCSACGMLLKDILEDMEGVKSADFDDKSGTGIVEFDAAAVSKDEIVSAIEQEGYKVK